MRKPGKIDRFFSANQICEMTTLNSGEYPWRGLNMKKMGPLHSALLTQNDPKMCVCVCIICMYAFTSKYTYFYKSVFLIYNFINVYLYIQCLFHI